ncbi:MAG TPA: delta-60 repeat domain-containing protein [Gammaproteobacteria bacterium]|nr:delta-60 repeat domain-containing protein [Gammaproteobacteria bacterium]
MNTKIDTRLTLRKTFLFAILITTCQAGLGAPGDPDNSFGTNGFTVTDLPPSVADSGQAVAVQPDGMILVAGTNNSNKFAIARYTSSGSLDNGFGTNGSTITDIPVSGMVHDMVLQPDGKILVCGVGNGGEFTVVRYLANGSLDTGFDSDGIATVAFPTGASIAYSMALQGDGKILLAGEVDVGGGVRQYALVRLDTAGNLDAAFDGDGRVMTDVGTGWDIAYAVAVRADGKIVAAGSTGSDISLVRYNTDGSLDTGFGTNGKTVTGPGALDDYAYALAIQHDGKIVIAGNAVANVADRGLLVARFDADGNVDSGFGTSGQVIYPVANLAREGANAIAIQPDGKIVVAGEYVSTQVPSNDLDIAVIRFDSDGTLDTTFATAGVFTHDFGTILDFSNAVAIQPDGKILAAGETDGDFFIVRLEGTSLDVTPDAISFVDETDVKRSQLQTSNLVTVSGLDGGVKVPVSVSGGEYALNGSATYTSGINWVGNGDQVNVRHTSASSENTTSSTVLRVGGVMAPNGTTHVGTGETVTDAYDTTTLSDTSDDDSGGGSGGGSVVWMFLLTTGLLLFFRFSRDGQPKRT